jgi:hypothetical protein
MGLPKPAGSGKREKISLDAAAGHLLEECRMVLPGVQALFGFQLIAVFNQGFGEKLSSHMTPAALHRQAEPVEVSERFIWLASSMVLAAMFPLALALALDIYVVASVVIASDLLAALIALGLLAVFAVLWLVLPRRESG